MPQYPDPASPEPDPRYADQPLRFGGGPGFDREAVRQLRAMIAADRYESPEKIEAAIDQMAPALAA